MHLGFSIADKGYFVHGRIPGMGNDSDDLWEYNPASDQWTNSQIFL